MPSYISPHLFSKYHPKNNLSDVIISYLKLKFYSRKYFLSKWVGGEQLASSQTVKMFEKNLYKEEN